MSAESVMASMYFHGHSKKWLGVDLDGTLAHYDGWNGIDHIGMPIMNVVLSLRARKEQGWGIAIFTARVSDPSEAIEAESQIWAWLEKHHIDVDGITCVKHKHFVEFWDDRARQVVFNKGVFVQELNHDHIKSPDVGHSDKCVDPRACYEYVPVVNDIDPIDDSRPGKIYRRTGVAEGATVGCSLDTQVGGSHYKDMVIQPAEYCEYNNIPAIESAVIKYVSRHMKKNGVQDLEKAKDLINMIIEMRYEPTGLNHLAARINSKRHNQFEKK